MDEEDDVLDIDKAIDPEATGTEDEMDGFHEVDPLTGSAVVEEVPEEEEAPLEEEQNA